MWTLPSSLSQLARFAVIVISLFVSHVQAGEYSVIMVEADENIHQFCMVYFSEFKELPESPDMMPYMKMVNMTAHDGCKKLQSVNLHGKVALIKDTANCTLDKVVLHFKAAQAYGIIISTPRFKVDNIIIDRNDTRRVDLVVGFVTEATSNSLLGLMKPKEPLLTKLFTKKKMSFDFSLIIIWLVAVFTLGVGSYWSGLVKHEIYQHEVGRCTHTGAATAASEAAVDGSQSKSENLMEEESSLDVSPVLVTLFVICMGVMLLLLYFFFQYLVFFIIGMFALASVVSVIGVLEPLIYMVPLGITRIPKNVCPCFHGPLEIRQLVLIIFAISVSVTWVVLRHHPQSWILQDLLGVAFSINMLKTLRMPNLMICSVLLILLFFYDIFFVFITPFLTMKGESIMVEVARGGNSQEQLPMVLRVPHLNNESLSVCFSQFSLLGFGDILVPGLLVAYCHGFDLLNTRNRVYFLSGTIFYGVGLVVTFVALYMMKTPQPALLYLVPATLIPTVCIAWCRGQLKEIWHGSKPAPPALVAPPPSLPATPSASGSDTGRSPSPARGRGSRLTESPGTSPRGPVPASPSINYRPDVPLLSAPEHLESDMPPHYGPPDIYRHPADKDGVADRVVKEDADGPTGANRAHDARQAGENSPLNNWGDGQPLVKYMSTGVQQS
ncbi:signal peptide peptidase-like 2A [Ixodes scapularis]|uniref:signal peptide peptidase-like 2A n=1 Tax=Ixodes scapularis TaxID=6945 RepID=UPI001A9EB07F|nr:signal peptide peptidase-like 2A [Ixodes scapularis]